MAKTKTNVTYWSLGQAVYYSCCAFSDLVLKANRLWDPSLVGEPSYMELIDPRRTLRATRGTGLFISVKQNF